MGLFSTKEKFFPLIVHRTVVFFFVLCLLTLLLYFAGTAQSFLDTTQIMLLSIYIALSIFLAVISLFGAALGIRRRFFVQRKVRELVQTAVYALLSLFAVVTSIAAAFIVAVSRGNV